MITELDPLRGIRRKRYFIIEKKQPYNMSYLYEV